MEMKMYEIDVALTDAIEQALDPETGEIVDAEAYAKFEELAMARDEKIEGLILWMKDLVAYAEAVKEERDNLFKLQQAATNKAVSLRKYIGMALDGEKFQTARTSVTYRKSTRVEVSDLWQLPEDYLRYREPEADKAKIKAALKAGTEVPGAELVDDVSMIVR